MKRNKNETEEVKKESKKQRRAVKRIGKTLGYIGVGLIGFGLGAKYIRNGAA